MVLWAQSCSLLLRPLLRERFCVQNYPIFAMGHLEGLVVKTRIQKLIRLQLEIICQTANKACGRMTSDETPLAGTLSSLRKVGVPLPWGWGLR